uniref:LysR family transcriptional regulator n=1 Tax=Thaumasiovibrio subtropicus TaxID=1891207 RepID=UPI000B34E39F|nr:LysR family transcriptional regulator [Thaumasiovibrio subtropicus]
MSSKLEELDLNLLKLLRVVVETRNTSLAAEKLGISQTSVSRGLAKLREVFGDQLFIRKAHGVEPSELAERLAEASEQMLNPIMNVVDSYQRFNALEFEGQVTIALELSLLDIFGHGIHQALHKVLPKARLELVYWQEETLHQLLDRQIDYAVQFSLLPMPQEIYMHHLSDIKICLLARKEHPVLSHSSDWEAIHQLPLVLHKVNALNSKRQLIEEFYLDNGYKPNVCLVSHSTSALVHHLVNSDAIQFGSSYQRCQSEHLGCYSLPKIPSQYTSFSISGCYLQSKRGYPLNQLLHQSIQTFFDSVEQPEMR